MTRSFALVIGLTTMFATGTVSAQDATPEEESATSKLLSVGTGALSGWTGTAGLGASFTSGNAESSNVNGSIRLIKSFDKWDHVLTASVFKGTSTVLVTQRNEEGVIQRDDAGFPIRDIVEGDNSDRLAIGYQPKYYVNDRLYVFGILDYETDKPGNIDSSSRQLIGLGYSFYRDESGYLSGEFGLGNKSLNPVIGDDLDGAIGYVGVNYLNRITDTVTLNADLRSDFGSDNTFLEIGLGAAFKLSDRFSLKVSHFSRSNTDLKDPSNPIGSSTDSITTLNLVIDI